MRMCVVYCRSRATRLAQRRSAADGERSAMADTGAESNEKYMEGNNGQTSFPARHCASALGLLAMAPRPSVRHKSEFYQNGRTDRDRFWYGG